MSDITLDTSPETALDLDSALERLEERMQEQDPELKAQMERAVRELTEGNSGSGIPIDLDMMKADLRKVVISYCQRDKIEKMTREQAFGAFTVLNQMRNEGRCWASLLPHGAEAHELWCAAEQAAKNAYAPYSGHRVGAAILTSSGKIYSGCRVESASYDCIHAEEATLAAMVNAGEHSPLMLAVVAWQNGKPYGEVASPCGGSLQKLIEFAQKSGYDLDVISDYLALAVGRGYKTIKLSKLLPGN